MADGKPLYPGFDTKKIPEEKSFEIRFWPGMVIVLVSIPIIVYTTVWLITQIEKEHVNNTWFIIHLLLDLIALGATFFTFIKWGKL
jgi:hypothetical protein